MRYETSAAQSSRRVRWRQKLVEMDFIYICQWQSWVRVFKWTYNRFTVTVPDGLAVEIQVCSTDIPVRAPIVNPITSIKYE